MRFVAGQLAAFEPAFASTVCQWARTDEEVYQLAPSTSPPLTAAKVLDWRRPDGRAFVYVLEDSRRLVAYGELNPMYRKPNHLWLGHCVVDPALRGQGLGTAFVQELLHVAFHQWHACSVSLIVFPENDSALRCYKRAGFRYAADEFHQFSPGAKARLLRLEAQPKPVG